MEFFDVYDAEKKKTGRTVARGKTIDEQVYHLSVHVCIFNSDGEMLIQQRQKLKSGWSGYWDLSAGGCVTAGEDSRSGAERETYEELGIKVDLQESRPALTVHFAGGFDDVYLIERDLELSELRLQKEEVRAAAWAKKEKILEMIDAGTFIAYHKSYIELLFDMLKSRDVRSRKEW